MIKLSDSDKSFIASVIISLHKVCHKGKKNENEVDDAWGSLGIDCRWYNYKSMSMNHVIEINKKHYLVRQQAQKIILLTFPALQIVQKYYINVTHSYLNVDTRELLVLYQNQITILKPALAPLQFVNNQQAFIDWEPQGGILLNNAIVLYGAHSIVFYSRGTMIEKAWEIDIVQQIQCLKSTPRGDSLAMKVRSPDNSLFLWNTGDPSVKPSQEIILTQSILEWQFVSDQLLTILTHSELRLYHREASGAQFNLYHFYQLTSRNFSWVAVPNSIPSAKQSISTLILLNRNGECSVIELPAVQKRTEQSQIKEVGKVRLQYKQVNMRRVLAAWGQEGKLALVCETKNHSLFCFLLSSALKIQLHTAYEDLLGAQINAVYCHNDTVLARDRSRWKLFKLNGVSNLCMIDQVDCQKAFILDESTMLCLDNQSFFVHRQGKHIGEPIPFKYADSERVQYIGHANQFLYLVAGIRFYRWGEGGLSVCGVALRNERAILVQANPFERTLLYKIGEQYMLLAYRIDNQKVAASSIKSSPNYCFGLNGGLWAQKLPLQIKVGSGDKVMAIFSLNRLLKMLDCQNQSYQYTLHSIFGGGMVMILKNYVFFLQLVQDERGYELVLLKRLNSLLYRRFSPHSHALKLVEPNTLTFWVGNQVMRIGNRINQHTATDPFSLPETLLAKQLDLRKIYPPHHPRLLLALFESNRFQLAFQVLHRVYDWFHNQQTIGELYKALSVDFLADCDWSVKEDSISLFSGQRLQEEQTFLKKFSEELLENTEKIQLKEKNPLIFESLISSLAVSISNSKSVDYFSQSVMLLLRTYLRPRSLNSMHIILLSHSLNKQEALAEMRNDKTATISWEWIRNNGLPFWYDNKEELRKIIEQVAANEYRAHKDPFDSLFWYLLVGKRSLIATLFKNHRLNSKEHDAAANFLLRDFTQPKDRTAAVKNAYVLIDKKRYFHAMAFFILGGAIDDCIRICVDRLRDLSLAYTFVLYFKQANNAYLFGEMGKGDMWMRHLTYRLGSQHIKSYNALFESAEAADWTYTPELASFHPILPQFATRLRNSVGVRRQLDAQNAKKMASQDIFADFYGDEQQTNTQQECQKVSLQGDPDSLKDAVIRYYMRQGLPSLALIENQSHQEALESYNYEKYKLSGEVDSSMQHTIANLQDKVGLAQCLINANKLPQLLHFMHKIRQEYLAVAGAVSLGVVVHIKKHSLGELMRLGYQSQQVLTLLKKGSLWGDKTNEFQHSMKKLRQLTTISKVVAALLLHSYEDIVSLLDGIDERSQESQDSDAFWNRLKAEYDRFHQTRKQKSIKQMDHFQHAFIAVKRRAQEEEVLRTQLLITREEAAILQLRLLVLNYFIKVDLPLKEQIEAARKDISHCLKNWISADSFHDIIFEYKTLIREGSQAKIKLNILKSIFDEQFVNFYDIVALTHDGYFDEKATQGMIQGPQDLQGIEVFRNRNDGVRSFTINQYDSRGLECIVMFKKGLKKFELCQNLANRERNKDTLALIAQDSFYTALSNTDPRTIERGRYSPSIQRALTHILEERRDEHFPRSFTAFSGKEYLRQVEPPYLDYNQLNSIECHPFLPFFLIGGKGNVELAHLSTLKNFDRIKCPQVGQIVRLHSNGQRIGVADTAGNLGIHVFDNKFLNSCVFNLKKAGVVDFSFMRPSVLAVLSNTSVNVYDTLLHPKHQLKFKQSFTKDPISVTAIDETRLAVLRKNEVLIYDIRMQKLESSKELKGKGKSMLVQGRKIFVGQSDCKVKVLSIVGQETEIIKLGVLDEKDRDRVAVDEIHSCNDILLASTSEGSIFYLPKLSK